MSFKPELQVNGEWATNSTRFETEEEAKAAAYDIFNRWLLCSDYRASPSNDPVTHKLVDGLLQDVPPG